jgi:hypothetical protein
VLSSTEEKYFRKTPKKKDFLKKSPYLRALKKE